MIGRSDFSYLQKLLSTSEAIEEQKVYSHLALVLAPPPKYRRSLGWVHRILLATAHRDKRYINTSIAFGLWVAAKMYQ